MTINFSTSEDSCAKIAVAITPANSDLVESVRALYVGTGGALRVTTVLGNDVTFTNVADGSILPVSVKRVWSTSTTASNIIGLV
jgi:hypothetical protein